MAPALWHAPHHNLAPHQQAAQNFCPALQRSAPCGLISHALGAQDDFAGS